MVTPAMQSAPPTAADAGTTLPALFWQVACRRTTAVALRWKHLGIWNDITWSDYGDAARAVGLALLAAGGRRGDRALVLSDVRPEWCHVEFGAMGVGVQTVGLYHTDTAQDLVRVARDSAARWLFVQDQEQLDKALAVLPDMPRIERIVHFDGSGLHALVHAQVQGFEDFLETGRTLCAQQPALWEAELQRARSGDVATVVTTAGRTGVPKCVQLTHASLMFQLQALGSMCPAQPGDEQLGFLSPGYVVERYFTLYRALTQDIVVHLGKGLPTMLDNLREVRPHVVMAVPRVWEKLYATVMLGIEQGTPLQRRAYHWAMNLGARLGAGRESGQAPGSGLSIWHTVADRLVLRRVRAMIGLDRARQLLCCAAPISPELVQWFEALGLPMVEAYGQAECTGIATLAAPTQARAGRVGPALPGTELRVAPDGQILLRGPHVFAGYLQPQPQDGLRVVDGWLHTGDRGQLDAQGQLQVFDRMQAGIAVADGVPVSPAGIESRLKRSPYIADALVVEQDGRLGCLLLIEAETVQRHVARQQLVITGFGNLTHASEVRALIQQDVDRVNRELGAGTRIARFALIDTEISVHDTEMTPTLQLRRRLVLDRHRALVDSLFAESAA